MQDSSDRTAIYTLAKVIAFAFIGSQWAARTAFAAGAAFWRRMTGRGAWLTQGILIWLAVLVALLLLGNYLETHHQPQTSIW